MNFLFVLLVIIIFNYIECEDKCPADWDTYDDQRKCLKIVDDSLQTYTNSMATCAKLAPNATLLTIHSAGEQDFMNQYLYVDNKLVDTIWLGGVVQGNNNLTWLDNSPVSYTNWFQGRPQQQQQPHQSTINCVEQQSEPTTLGKWYDIYCNKRNQVVCQLMLPKLAPPIDDDTDNAKLLKMIQAIQLYTEKLQQQLLGLETNYQNINKQLAVVGVVTAVPVGFIYVQLPGQQLPSQLWPAESVKWQEITADYEGLFFRVLGAGSAPFGQLQSANSSGQLSTIRSRSCYTGNHGSECDDFITEIPESGWSPEFIRKDFSNDMYFYMTSGENRPRNTAIRIFKRI
ncbi:uncharacterized protein LOC128953395 [Oppia nitens]|uniref:uncharacterized protein LOC128953395 n=1 Tax=Oppia nitens TaxID=1686743 RepID=UPI0023DA2AB8|nr:uncharacterized protein LOC128953395 [Oppia nitens]